MVVQLGELGGAARCERRPGALRDEAAAAQDDDVVTGVQPLRLVGDEDARGAPVATRPPPSAPGPGAGAREQGREEGRGKEAGHRSTVFTTNGLG